MSALHRSELNLLDWFPFPAWHCDRDGQCDYLNRKWLDFTGKTLEQALGDGWTASVHPDDFEALMRAYRQAFQACRPFALEYRLRRQDGEYRWVVDHGSVWENAGGHFAGYLGACYDVTERKRAEARLRDSEERFQQLAENIDEIFWIWDREQRRVVYVSPAYETICGRSCESLCKPEPGAWLDTIHPDDRQRMLQLRAEQRDDDHDEELRILRPDGSVRWIRDRAFPVRDAAGQVIRIAGLVEDVTERRQLEMQLRQAQKMEAIGQLAGGVAHDFNNLLSVIFGHSELLTAALPSPERLRDSLTEISRAAERAAALTRQLLTFSRRQAVEARVLDLEAVVTESGNLLRRLIGEDVRLALILSPRLSAVRADLGQIDQVLMNLALNARDAMPQGGLLTIETREVNLDAPSPQASQEVRPGRYVLLTVTDTGGGMTPEVQERIFEPFFTTKRDGTGLGLSVVDGIVRQSGGHVSVESRLGFGTTFKVYLPALDEPAVNPPESVLPVPPKGGGETALLVEDEDPVREVTALLLNTLGYQVVQASCAEEALRRFETSRGKINLLMTDLVMPGMNGRELANTLRGQDPTLKVLFQSGYTHDSVVRRGIVHAEMAFLKKPFTLDALARKVREVLDGS